MSKKIKNIKRYVLLAILLTITGIIISEVESPEGEMIKTNANQRKD